MMSLQEFIRRQQVLRLFRAAVRTAAAAPPDTRTELRMQIRQEFELWRTEEDELQRKYLLHTGQQRVEELRSMLGMRHNMKPGGLPVGF